MATPETAAVRSVVELLQTPHRTASVLNELLRQLGSLPFFNALREARGLSRVYACLAELTYLRLPQGSHVLLPGTYLLLKGSVTVEVTQQVFALETETRLTALEDTELALTKETIPSPAAKQLKQALARVPGHKLRPLSFFVQHWDQFEQVSLCKGQSLFAPGDSAKVCYVLLSGRVKLVKSVHSFQEHVKMPVSLIGEDDLLHARRHTYTASCCSDTAQLITIPLHLFGNLFDMHYWKATVRVQQQESRQRQRLRGELVRTFAHHSPSKVPSCITLQAKGLQSAATRRLLLPPLETQPDLTHFLEALRSVR